MKRKIISFILVLLIVNMFSFNYIKVYASNPLGDLIDGIISAVEGTVDSVDEEAKEEKPEEGSVDEVMSDADDFIKEGEDNASIDEELLGETSDFLYNLLLAFGIIAAVIVGSVLGVKYMLGSVEEKAEYKETLLAYFISCVVVFGAFGIWKLVINILSSF